MVIKRRRHPPSSIDKLGQEVKRLIADLLADPEKQWTIEDIRLRLVEMGKPVSWSALRRHIKTEEEVGAELRYAYETATVLAKNVPHGEDDRLARLNIELLYSGIFQLQTAIRDGKPMEAGKLMAIAVAIEKAAAATARLQQIEERADKRAADKMKAKLTEMAKKPGSGLTKETVDKIYHAVLGVQS